VIETETACSAMLDSELPQWPRARTDLLFRQLDDEWVVFDPVGKRMHVLNETASLIWRQLDGQKSLEQVVDVLCQACEPPASPERVARDVDELTRKFLAEGLLM
jgi:hypothetical protein